MLLRTALQDRAQEVLLKYLRGEEVPQTRGDFQSAALWFEAALALDPEASPGRAAPGSARPGRCYLRAAFPKP